MLNVPGPRSGLRNVCPTCGGSGRAKVFVTAADPTPERLAEMARATAAQRCPTCRGSGSAEPAVKGPSE